MKNTTNPNTRPWRILFPLLMMAVFSTASSAVSSANVFNFTVLVFLLPFHTVHWAFTPYEPLI